MLALKCPAVKFALPRLSTRSGASPHLAACSADNLHESDCRSHCDVCVCDAPPRYPTARCASRGRPERPRGSTRLLQREFPPAPEPGGRCCACGGAQAEACHGMFCSRRVPCLSPRSQLQTALVVRAMVFFDIACASAALASPLPLALAVVFRTLGTSFPIAVAANVWGASAPTLTGTPGNPQALECGG